MNEHTIEGESESVSTGVDWLTRVDSRCVKRVERSRVVSFRVPEPLADVYLDLPSVAKTAVKVVVMSLVYALAKKYNIDDECEEQHKPFLSEAPAARDQIIINANIAEAKPTINVNIDTRAIEDAVRLLEYLFQEASRNMPTNTRRVLKRRVRRAEKALHDLLASLDMN